MRWHWPLSNLSMLFLLPFFLAYGTLVFMEHFQLYPKTKGCFPEPPLEINLENAQFLNGKTAINKWVIVQVKGDQAIADEPKRMLQQLHTALGPNRDRVTIVAMNAQDLFPAFQFSTQLILNPQQMCIMHYRHTDYDGLLKDIRKLLKYSHV